MRRLTFEIKEKMVQLSGACFWYWNSFYSFLESSGVSSSLFQRFPKEAYNKYSVMRNVLASLEEGDRLETINGLVSNFYRLTGPVDRDKLDNERARQLLVEFREAVGNDPIEVEIERRKGEQKRDEYKRGINDRRAREAALQSLNQRFFQLLAGTDVTPQERGFALEVLFFDLLNLEELECAKPYRTPGREQIDGQFKFEKFDYLVEVKWITGSTKQEHLSIFDGKIRGKAQSTRGFFLAADGFDETAVAKFSGDAPRIVLMITRSAPAICFRRAATCTSRAFESGSQSCAQRAATSRSFETIAPR